MSGMRFFLAICEVAVGGVALAAAEFNVRDIGAVGDGVTKDTAAVQKALDACVGTGGRVIVPAGTYLIGTIRLKDRTELRLEKGATLLGSPDLRDYNADDAYPQNFGSKAERWSGKHLVLALEAKGVAITGEGTIDGNGASFMAEPSEKMPRYDIVWRHGYLTTNGRQEGFRPGQEIAFVECANVRVEGVTLRNMAMWTCFFHGCENVTVRDVRVRNDMRFANTDGFDFDTCRNVVATGCDIVSGDDAFAIRCCPGRLRDKSKRVCENIVVSNCTSATAASGIRVAVGDGAVRNVRFCDYRMKEAGHALLVQSKYPTTKYRGLDIEDVEFSNFTIENSPAPILVIAGTPDASAKLRNVVFRDIRATFDGRVMIAGEENLRPDGVRFENVTLTVTKPPKPVRQDWELGTLTADDPVVSVTRADNVTFRNVKVVTEDGLARKRLDVRDATGFVED